MKFIKKIISILVNEVHALAWTLAGAVTVLITLSGVTRQQGLWITVVALFIHLLGVVYFAFSNKDNDENN